MRQIFRRLSSIIVFAIGPAFAAGTAYYITSRVAITSVYDWGVVQQSTSYQNTYGISASYSPLASVSISGDPEFTLDAIACPGARSCSATASFAAAVAFALPPEASAAYGYLLLQAYGNTRQQAPVRVTLVLLPND